MERLLSTTFMILLIGAVVYVITMEGIKHYAEWQLVVRTKYRATDDGNTKGGDPSSSPRIVFEDEEVGRYELITRSEYPHTYMVLDTVEGIIYEYNADTDLWYSYNLKTQAQPRSFD